MADVAVKSFEFRVTEVYSPYIVAERVSFFRRLSPFLDDPKRIVLVGDWNATLNPNKGKVIRGARGSGMCEISLIDFMARHNLVDWFPLDHSGMDMWTWRNSLPSVRDIFYQDRVLFRRADTDFVVQTDHRLVRVSLWLADRPSLAGYWKFNNSLLEIRDLRDRLESIVQRVLMRTVTGNKWWRSLKHRIRDVAIKYGRHLNIDMTKMDQSLEDKLSRMVEGGFPSRRFS